MLILLLIYECGRFVTDNFTKTDNGTHKEKGVQKEEGDYNKVSHR